MSRFIPAAIVAARPTSYDVKEFLLGDGGDLHKAEVEAMKLLPPGRVVSDKDHDSTWVCFRHMRVACCFTDFFPWIVVHAP